MKNISKPSCLTSALSLALAVALTLTVVAGSGMTAYALSPQEKDEVSVLLRKGTEPVTFTHEPFEGGNHIIYLPLREALTAFGFAPENITVDTQRSERWEYYEQNGKEFGAPGTLLYSVILKISEQNTRKRYQAFTFNVCDQQFYIPVWDAVSTGPNALFDGNAVAVDGGMNFKLCKCIWEIIA